MLVVVAIGEHIFGACAIHVVEPYRTGALAEGGAEHCQSAAVSQLPADDARRIRIEAVAADRAPRGVEEYLNASLQR